MWLIILLSVAFIFIFSTIYVFISNSFLDNFEEPKNIVDALMDEILIAISLGQFEVVHSFDPAEPLITSDVICSLTAKLALSTTPHILIFNVENNGDMRIKMRKI